MRSFPPTSARPRALVVGTSVAGAGLLGVALSSTPGTTRFSVLTLGTAATWVVGAVGSGPLHRGWSTSPEPHRPVVLPVVLGAGAFAAFYGCALVARRLPVLERASRVLRFGQESHPGSVLATALVSGLAEEVFFRGAVYAAAGPDHPVTVSTAVYALSTGATRNPALVLASVAMGTLFGLQRRATGGLQAPILTHLTWSTLMLRFLPRLFPASTF